MRKMEVFVRLDNPGKGLSAARRPRLQLKRSLRWATLLGMAGMYCVDDLMNLAAREGAEELRLQAGQPPVMVVKGAAHALNLPPLTSDNVTELFRSFATEDQVQELQLCGDVRFNHVFQNSARFGISASLGREGICLKMKNLGR